MERIIREARIEDLLSIWPRAGNDPIDASEVLSFADRLVPPHIGISIVSGEQILACAGIEEMWPGVGHAWAVVSQEAVRRPFTVVRALRDRLQAEIAARGLWRVETTVRVGWKEALRFAKWLHFKEEGILRKYDPEGRDHWMVARVS